MDIQSGKRTHDQTDADVSIKKKQKKDTSNTIPIMRGRFKQRWLSKHSSLLKRADSQSGLMVSCGVKSETRALGQVQQGLERYVQQLFPQCELTWERFEGDLDVEETEEVPQEKVANRKEKRFQAVDAACGGLIFYRFKINVKPTEFLNKLIDYLSNLSKEERMGELNKLNHCARWIPLDFICPATTERMAKCFERLAEVHLKDKTTTSISVAIITEIRNNMLIKKEDIIQTIAPLIPSNYKVDLKNPTLVIFVTVFKSVCGMSTLENYYGRKKYNLAALFDDNSKKE
ncbi:THUMP domain-containing protein 1 [Apophysomyces ossiformis]|uniref:THUMP domain-containing protein 1 n=1 Tax=Apophysomyces ossiformis TaxID=679940 RepID=A0A8H7ERP5_9FUNG|nr:THUMP domain-containing protein 1 [Apophysomyces ossiformis]KAF7727551.1 THUMP domain-containing protein 1 [Apophysomyces ossiformis]